MDTQRLFPRHRIWQLAATLVLAVASGATWAQSTFTVTTVGDAGAGSLRQAILDANANSDRSTIRFAIAGSGPFTIKPKSEYQEFTAPVIVQGYSQPGSVVPLVQGGGTIMIEIDATNIADNPDNHGGTFTFVRGAERSAVSGIAFIGSGAGGRSRAAVLALADGVRVSASYFGLRADGSTTSGIDAAFGGLCADRVTFGGNGLGDGNLVAKTSGAAVLLTGSGHTIANNWFGMDRFGKTSFGNVIGGQAIISGAIAYGAPARLARTYSVAVQQSYFGMRSSRIAANRITQTIRDAILILLTTSNNNTIIGNTLGLDLWATPGPNLDGGIRLSRGVTNTAMIDNRIARANYGILLGDARTSPPEVAGTGNQLSRNLINDVAYTAIGIDANSQFMPRINDGLDVDTGANNLQNKPVLTYANETGRVDFELMSEANKTYRIEFFLTSSCLPIGFGGSDMFLGETRVVTDGNGKVGASAQTTQAPLGGLRPGTFMTAIATEIADLDGDGVPETPTNSSEFSACQPIQALVPTTTMVTSLPTHVPATDPSIRISAKVSANGGTPMGNVAFFLDTDGRSDALGTTPLSAGVATLSLANPLPRAGAYAIRATYLGDSRFRGSEDRREVVVFRPASALIDYRLTSFTRQRVGASDFEVDNTRGSWMQVTAPMGARYLDAAQFRDERLDRLVTDDPANTDFLLYDVINNRVDPVVSNSLKSTDRIVDFTLFDGDSRMDALTYDPSRAAHNMVSCVFERDNCERFDMLPPKPEFRVTITGDFNGDGRQDLMWRDPSGSRTYVWLMDGPRMLSEIQGPPVPTGLLAAAAGDFNGDGVEDVAWYEESQGTVEIWYMGAGKVIDRAVDRARGGKHYIIGPAHLAVAGDPDYGQSGITWWDQSSGEVFVWREMIASGGRLSYNPVSVFVDPSYTPMKTR